MLIIGRCGCFYIRQMVGTMHDINPNNIKPFRLPIQASIIKLDSSILQNTPPFLPHSPRRKRPAKGSSTKNQPAFRKTLNIAFSFHAML